MITLDILRAKCLHSERFCIWEIAFPMVEPVGADIELDTLARLDMTGAAIVGTDRTAANEYSPTITIAHIVHTIARQYWREARLLTASELGPYAILLQEAR